MKIQQLVFIGLTMYYIRPFLYDIVNVSLQFCHCYFKQGMVARLDACPRGMQMVAVQFSHPATICHGVWPRNNFYGYSLPSANSRRAVVIYWRKNVH